VAYSEDDEEERNESAPRRLTVDHDWLRHPYTQELLSNLRAEATVTMVQLHEAALSSSDADVRAYAVKVSMIQEQVESIEKGFLKNDSKANSVS
jgi:hypothetical protein